MRGVAARCTSLQVPLNESPSEKEGKSRRAAVIPSPRSGPSMKVPPKRKGNWALIPRNRIVLTPSMKVPPKRKGNPGQRRLRGQRLCTLNESPSEKEGKFQFFEKVALFQLFPQ